MGSGLFVAAPMAEMPGCPWCGDVPRAGAAPDIHSNPTLYAVVCMGCGASGPQSHDHDEAVKFWALVGGLVPCWQLDEGQSQVR